ncbi:MAG: hypothetical protein WD426_00680 [Anditalea sp.]
MAYFWTGNAKFGEDPITYPSKEMKLFISLVLWAILLVLCWPIALLLLVIYPIVWLILLPFRLLGLGVTLSLSMVAALLMLPFALLR